MTDISKPKPKFWRRKSFVALSVVTLALAGGLTALVTPKQVSAADMVCHGKNIFAQLEETRPGALKAIEASAAAIPYSDGIAWKVEKVGAQTSYIFGTMHMSDPRLLDLDPKVERAFNASATLALEVTEVLNPELVRAKASELVQYTTYMDGTDITSRLSDEDEERVKAIYRERGSVPWFMAKRLKPWALMGALATPACETARKAGGKPFLDQMLAQRAEKAGMKLVGLETVEGQVKAFAALPEDMMLTALTETAKLGDQMDDLFETMIQLYEAGEIAKIKAMMAHLTEDGIKASVAKKSDYAVFQDVMIDKRNVTMADGAQKLIDAGGGAFIAVGALHLPGEKGLLAILAQRGYTINPL